MNPSAGTITIKKKKKKVKSNINAKSNNGIFLYYDESETLLVTKPYI